MAPEEEKPHALAKSVETLSKAQNVREEAGLLMKPYAKWEEFLIQAPLSIAILGELIFISTGQQDFSINECPPKGGFLHLKYPQSFKASLCQMCNQGWSAFNEAHTNMDQIRLLTRGVPERMKRIIQTLLQDTEVMAALIPNQLKNLQALTEQCERLTKAVKEKFTDVLNLIQELLETCCSAQQGYEKELGDVQIALKQAQIREKSAKLAQEMAELYHQQVKEQVEESFQQYKKAMGSIPTGWDAVGMEVATSLIQTLGTLSVEFTHMLTMRQGSLEGAAGGSGGRGLTSIRSLISPSIVCSKSAELLTFTTSLKNLLDRHGSLKISMILDEKSRRVKTEWVKENFQRLKDSIEKEADCEAKTKVQEICQAGLDVCQQLEKMASSEGGLGQVGQSFLNEINHLHKKAAEFDSYSKSYTRSPAFFPKPPNVSKIAADKSSGLENAQLKVKQSLEALKATHKEYQRSFENLKKQNEELTEILYKMRGYHAKEVDFDISRKMLIQALNALTQVKEQWEKMMRFFQIISTLIESSFVWSVKEFADRGNRTKSTSSYSSTAFTTDLLYGHIFNVFCIAQPVGKVFESSTLVSEKHLMPRLNRLGRILSMDPNQPVFAAERIAFAEGCDAAREAVKEVVLKMKAEFEQSLEAREEAIEREMRAFLPANWDSAEPQMRELSLEEESKFI